MCGICGAISLQHGYPVNRKLVYNMNRVLFHRGPDDEGYYFSNNIGMGMRRLSIIDLQTGEQPIHNEDQTLWVVFNGEIYNYRELRHELVQKGHQFYTKSDTEVIVHAYEAWGEDFLSKLNGMFAIALWDEKKQQLILARDVFGIKPLYVYQNGKVLLFASEIKSLLVNDEIPRKVDKIALDLYLTFRFVPSPRTMLEGIEKVPPSHCLIVNDGRVTRKRYEKSIPEVEKHRKEAEWVELLRDLISVAVKRQSVSDVPLGVLLSGGVDSAAVTALLSRHLNGPLQTFTVGFPDYQGIDELEAANETARLFNTQHHAIKIGYIDFQSHLMKTIWRLDEPIATTSTFALDAVCSTAKEYVKVVLTGQGADEPFGGYQRYLAARYGRVINKWFSPLWLWGRSITRRMFPRWEAWQRAWHSVGVKDQTQWFIAMIEVFSPAMKEKIYQDRKDDKESFSRAVIDYWRKDIDHLEPLSQMSYVDMRLSLADDLLMYGDKISMAHSLEMRVPLLDIELIKAVETMPDRMRINGFKRKYIYKKALKEWLPKENLNRPKKGFLTPVEFWLEQDLGNYATQLFFDRKSALSQYFSIGYIKELLDNHIQRKSNNQRQLYCLLVFELWHKVFIEREFRE